MITKQDFKAVAKILMDAPVDNGEETRVYIASQLSDYFKSANPNFKQGIFLIRSGIRASDYNAVRKVVV